MLSLEPEIIEDVDSEAKSAAETTTNKVVKSIVRHALTAVGGILVAKGVLPPEIWAGAADSIATVLVGVGCWGFSQGWSLIEKLRP